MAGNAECEKPEHRMHICALQDQGMSEKNPDRFEAMTTPARYECGNCGARAAKAEYLCRPVQL